MQKNIETAKINIIKEFGIDKLPKEKQEEVLIQMSDIMQQRITERFINELSEEKQVQFLELIANENTAQEVVDTFIAENLPQSETIILEEIGNYKKESIELFQQMATK